ncbi:hypothetical protein [Glutamicibacter sp. TV12E]|uniref:hypothetical protein n=1 Tax=Glutamicibacter sp. TV12E TaxID=3446362 RepID=UPI0040339D4D
MKKALIITGCAIAVLLGVIYGLRQHGDKPDFGMIAWILFGLALVAGFTRRLIVARRAGKPREGFEPLRDASTAFENMAMGRAPDDRPDFSAHQGQHLPKSPGD